ncbi:acetyl-CoA carboxylase ACC1 [Ascoidea rubescens DSM 1968]|uniref:Biotin carboxylase n=1 Tax=Ascoidea rubescens DSM 1968 TaxID=1344418 RepID=A0A1D2VLZ0_9ASCO|nr:biotin carboxylase [Ascoidea rubescens DSM 1968]ODV62628.1 biotin carboxylase [Ascoidea rubescens DSM 1968]
MKFLSLFLVSALSSIVLAEETVYITITDYEATLTTTVCEVSPSEESESSVEIFEISELTSDFTSTIAGVSSDHTLTSTIESTYSPSTLSTESLSSIPSLVSSSAPSLVSSSAPSSVSSSPVSASSGFSSEFSSGSSSEFSSGSSSSRSTITSTIVASSSAAGEDSTTGASSASSVAGAPLNMNSLISSSSSYSTSTSASFVSSPSPPSPPSSSSLSIHSIRNNYHYYTNQIQHTNIKSRDISCNITSTENSILQYSSATSNSINHANTIDTTNTKMDQKYENLHQSLSPDFIGLKNIFTIKNNPNSIDLLNIDQALKEFVIKNNGHTIIQKVLIANNGIAAVKNIRSIRKWSYETFGNDKTIKFVVMATPEDLSANAEYIRMADQVVEVPGGTNNNNYANVDLILDIAERSDVDAVWAGWGHASENPLLPEKLAASPKKIIFIGPPGTAMRSLGDKISSTIVAQHAKVPCIPWSGTGIDQVHINEKNGLVSVDDEIYIKCCCTSPQDGLKKAKKIGFPVMIKASEGGGGKGIRKAESEDNFVSLYEQAAHEIPGSPIFIMKLAGNARHIEVQILSDQYKNTISLFGRDCSVQRRHQKIIEEAPVTIVKPKTFQKMEQAAVRLGNLVGYVSAGTIEYLYSHIDDKFYFLELNPRLQVEHPTTEMVSGVNLPAAQLQVAMGIPLELIQDIRLFYGADPHTQTPIDFSFDNPESLKSQRKPTAKGHVTACRITSEDPNEGFKPSGGSLHDLNFRSSSNVWGYFSVGNNGGIHSFSDSQFGHIFAFGENRASSRKHMIVALKELSIRGDFRTTVEYLIKLLETSDFEDNTITTGWLDELISKKLTAERPDPTIAVICGAITKAFQQSEINKNSYVSLLEKGQVPPKELLKTIFIIDFIYDNMKYKFTCAKTSNDSYKVFINGSQVDVIARPLSDGGLLVALGGSSHTVYYKDEVESTRLSVDSKTCLLEVENDPTQLRTPSPGKLVKYLVEDGDHLKSGAPYAEVEVMKMVMPLITSEDGIVSLLKQPGSIVNAGDILAILALDDPTKVVHAKPFEGTLRSFGPAKIAEVKSFDKFKTVFNVLENILQGYDNQVVMKSCFKDLLSALRDPQLPFSAWDKEISNFSSRLEQSFVERINHIVEKGKFSNKFPAKLLKKLLMRYLNTNPEDKESVKLLIDICDKFYNGLLSHELKIISCLLDKYYETEILFIGKDVEEVILSIRDNQDINKVVEVVLSHSGVVAKNNLVLEILNHYQSLCQQSSELSSFLKEPLRKLVELESRSTAKVALKAREILIQCSLPTFKERSDQLEHILKSSVVETHYGEIGVSHRKPQMEILKDVIDSKYVVFDVLTQFLNHKDAYVALAAAEVYIRRAYRSYSINEINHYPGDIPFISWKFQMVDPGFKTKEEGSSAPMGRAVSVSDLSFIVDKNSSQPLRIGLLVPCVHIEDIDENIVKALESIPKRETFSIFTGPVPNRSQNKKETLGVLSNICNVFVGSVSGYSNETEILDRIKEYLEDFKEDLIASSIRRITFVLESEDGSYPKYYTFTGPKYQENTVIRHVEPALAFQLELNRLSNFNIKPVFTNNRNIHIYEAVGKNSTVDKRYFTRGIIRTGRIRDGISTAEYLTSEANRLMSDILDSLSVIDLSNSDLNHIFINFSAFFNVTPKDVEAAFGGFLERFGRRLWRLRITAAEIRITCTDPNSGITFPLRAFINNVSGFVVKSELYTEVKNTEGQWIFKSIASQPGPMHLRAIDTPYSGKEWLQPKRYKAHLMGTTYVYDFPELFKQAVLTQWKKHVPNAKIPFDFFAYKEIIYDGSELHFIEREPGANSIGMVGFKLDVKTPEYPEGRSLLVVANDITFKIGSFGPEEDVLFNKITEFARKTGLPRIYLSANSGARIGLADELIALFKVSWNEEGKPEKGFDYLYLDDEGKEEFAKSNNSSIITEEVTYKGEKRHVIKSIHSKSVGVDALRGSGLIAGATSRAYNDIFTISLVTCRSVGIGAYLVRLGQRAIQIEGQPIILTGAPAINKLLGKQVYSSNLQLGGTQIMYRNGVSHLTAADDLEGVEKIMEWLSYVPSQRGAPVPILENESDSWNRDVEYAPVRDEVYDARWLIEGKVEEDGEYLSGLFDRDSFTETLSGWAKGVVVGRARLGGIPFGVIAVEARTVENLIPADPANPESTEVLIQEAGQVWYPNSAFKTAQAINDFNNGEELPMMILANWRGFSGGQRDMFNEVLKYGSFIVDALVKYKQPAFIYIPPTGELRGGSWVVVDPTINSDMMEMYADVEARAGVLEPQGMTGIKYRSDKLIKTMERLDKTYADLKKQLSSESLNPSERVEIQAKLKARERALLPVYSQIAVQFADLHDRTPHMVKRGTIRRELQWENSRRFFYLRTRRRLHEEYILKQIAKELQNSTRLKQIAILKSWLPATLDYENDQEVANYLEINGKEIEKKLSNLKEEYVKNSLFNLLRVNRDEFVNSLSDVIGLLSDEDKKKLFDK